MADVAADGSFEVGQAPAPHVDMSPEGGIHAEERLLEITGEVDPTKEADRVCNTVLAMDEGALSLESGTNSRSDEDKIPSGGAVSSKRRRLF
ncbi:Os10g0338150 [Oryza sativa Japonica Group]|uniref:Os10g0338150 protein n=2 Tax=Oryza sativa subsp. japonica TaxID=39947 RepID=B9G835_ORYSJ|nr:hypothetical protein OsJ_31124 [Oryza sativa Japonica Group]KAF2913062.1 hypothetical protein DAI22_10g060150 [Oryza sativa Japonica Group]BAT10392.1 Os10g0338150 [Oryza sativa Japonica Group]